MECYCWQRAFLLITMRMTWEFAEQNCHLPIASTWTPPFLHRKKPHTPGAHSQPCVLKSAGEREGLCVGLWSCGSKLHHLLCSEPPENSWKVDHGRDEHKSQEVNLCYPMSSIMLSTLHALSHLFIPITWHGHPENFNYQETEDSRG